MKRLLKIILILLACPVAWYSFSMAFFMLTNPLVPSHPYLLAFCILLNMGSGAVIIQSIKHF
jgi:hypothetical protein